MPVQALKPGYKGEVKDAVANFHGNIVVYVHWSDHLLICAPIAVPLPPATPFRVIIEQIIPNAFAVHPDLAKIDWSTVTWQRDRKPFSPDLEKTLAENGIGHKSALVFTAPGLMGLAGVSA